MTERARQIVDELALAYPGSDPGLIEARMRAILSEARATRGFDETQLDAQLDAWRANIRWRRAHWRDAYAALSDLQRRLRGPRTDPQQRISLVFVLRSLVSRVVEHWFLVASLVTLIVGGFYGFAYARFYGILDTTPEQAGLSTAQIISHSLFGGLALVALLTIGTFIVFAPYVPFLEEADEPKPGDWTRTRVNLVVAVAVAVACGFVLHSIGFPPWLAAFICGIVFLPAIALHLRVVRRHGRRRPALRHLDFKFDNYVTVLVSTLGTAVLLTAAITYFEAGNLGNEARDGKAVRDPDIFGVPFLGVRAEPALVAWTDGRRPALAVPRCVFFLGASTSYAVLYDHRAERTIQVPVRDLALSLRRERTTCESPVNVRLPTVRRLANGRYRCHPGRWEKASGRTFSYRWSIEGDEVSERYGGRSAVLTVPFGRLGDIARCRVVAETPLGADVAISRGVVMVLPLPRKPSSTEKERRGG